AAHQTSAGTIVRRTPLTIKQITGTTPSAHSKR
ncbi:unnamed protein product, partial [Rotaria magnacalcarata]